MILSELWPELKALPHTIGIPWQDRSWFRRHTVNHLVGGAVLVLVFGQLLHNLALSIVGILLAAGWLHPNGDPRHLFALLWFPWLAWALAAGYTIARQGLMREAKGPREFPLYAMVWDSAASIGAAALVAWRSHG